MTPPVAPSDGTGTDRTLSVLVVTEDDPVADRLEAAVAGSRRQPREVRRAPRLHDALAVLDSWPCDVVVLDLDLPDSSGPSTYQRLAEADPEVAVVVLSAGLEDPAARRCLDLGADGVLDVAVLDRRLLDHTLLTAVRRRRAIARLRTSERRHALAVRGSGDGVLDWDLVSDTVHLSARWNAILGDEHCETCGPAAVLWERVHPEDLAELRAALDTHLAGGSRQVVREYRVRSSAGDYRWVLLRALAERDTVGRPRRLTGCLTDITDRKRDEERLKHDVLHDGLTGLANRALLLDRLEIALAGLRRNSDAHFAVLFLDLDHFKRVNDAYGHDVGDRLLVGLAARLRNFVRPGDTVARLGGDEFAVLLGNVGDVAAAVHVAERLIETLANPFHVDTSRIQVTGSVGIALSRTGYRRPEDLLRDADIAMYRAKSMGRATCRVFDPQMHRDAVTQLRIESDLRRSVEAGRFLLYYQPVVELAQGRLVGFEALLRWDHPDHGLIGPNEFLAVAESSGLIVPMGWWGLETACAQLRRWSTVVDRESLPWIAVNVSSKLVMRHDAVSRLKAIVERARIDPRRLLLEVTEHALLDHGDAAVRRIGEMRSLGVRVGIDDFGTGASSLTGVERCGYDILKIDTSRIGALEGANGGPRFVRSIVSLAGALGIEVVAEGVETERQFDVLRRVGCGHGQGYWFERPVSAERATLILGGSGRRWTPDTT
jgi:diguanylate cyclase (GGDEF)-like protein/PAS domain S-box-containing protein